ALIRWRSDFKTDGATRFSEELVPIRKLQPLHNRWTCEFTTALVPAVWSSGFDTRIAATHRRIFSRERCAAEPGCKPRISLGECVPATAVLACWREPARSRECVELASRLLGCTIVLLVVRRCKLVPRISRTNVCSSPEQMDSLVHIWSNTCLMLEHKSGL